MKKLLYFGLFLLLILVVVFTVRFIFGGPEDTWLCENNQWVKHGNPQNSPPATGCLKEAVKASKDDLIVLDSPLPMANIKSPLILTGKARGNWYFEGSFPVNIVDWDGLIIGEGVAKAKVDPDATAGAGWMTTDYVDFEATINFTANTGVSNHGSIILKKDNPSGLPENDNALEVPILFN